MSFVGVHVGVYGLVFRRSRKLRKLRKFTARHAGLSRTRARYKNELACKITKKNAHMQIK
jgi:hypothetical protein